MGEVHDFNWEKILNNKDLSLQVVGVQKRL